MSPIIALERRLLNIHFFHCQEFCITAENILPLCFIDILLLSSFILPIHLSWLRFLQWCPLKRNSLIHKRSLTCSFESNTLYFVSNFYTEWPCPWLTCFQNNMVLVFYFIFIFIELFTQWISDWREKFTPVIFYLYLLILIYNVDSRSEFKGT